MHNDPTLPVAKRKVKARDLMDLAETLGVTPEVALLAAWLDHAQGDLVRAWQRLEALVNRDPSNAEASRWLVRVQKEIKHRK